MQHDDIIELQRKKNHKSTSY